MKTMDLTHVLQDATTLGDWVLQRIAADSAEAAAIAKVQSQLPPAKQALEQGVEQALETIVDEALGKLPGGGVAIKFAGPFYDALIVRMVQRGFADIPGWEPPALPARPAAAAPSSAPSTTAAPPTAAPGAEPGGVVGTLSDDVRAQLLQAASTHA